MVQPRFHQAKVPAQGIQPGSVPVGNRPHRYRLHLDRLCFFRCRAGNALVAAQPHRGRCRRKICIQPVQRVDPAVFVPHLKMQVCPVTVAGIPAVADQLALIYRLPLGHAEFAQMGVQRLQPAAAVIRMAQLDHVAIAVDIPLGALAVPAVCDCNRARFRCIYWCTNC